MKKLFAVLALLWASTAFGQVFTTLYLPTVRENPSSSLYISLQGGRVFCGTSMVDYAGGNLLMTASTTNYIYLDTTSSCSLSVKTTTFVSGDIPIASIVTGTSTVTSVTDRRTPFQKLPTVAGTSWGSITGTLSSQSDLQTALNAKAGFPGAGIPKSTGSGWTTPAFGDIVALWASGSCSGYLKSDGTCSIPNINKLDGYFFPEDYGAKGNGQFVFDGAMANSSSNIDSASGKFVSSDVGKLLYIQYKDGSGVTQYLKGTISTYVSSTEINASFTNSSGSDISDGQVMWGTDDSVPIQDATDAALAVGGVVFFGSRVYIDDGYLQIYKFPYSNVRLTGTASGSTPQSNIGGYNPVYDSGSVLLFTGHPGGANTDCSAGLGSGAIQIQYPIESTPSLLPYNPNTEIDHLMLEYSDPTLGCVINAAKNDSDPDTYQEIYDIHNNTILGTMSALGTGQITDGLFTAGAIENRVTHNVFSGLARHDISLDGASFGMNSFSIKDNLFMNTFDPAQYLVWLNDCLQSGDISNNTFEKSYNAISAPCSNAMRYTSNWIGDSLQSTSGVLVSIVGGGNTIEGNYFEWARRDLNVYGISTNGTNKITGNVFQSFGNVAVILTGSAFFDVTDNVFRAAQSGALAYVYMANGGGSGDGTDGNIQASGNAFGAGITALNSYYFENKSRGNIVYDPGTDMSGSGITNTGTVQVMLTGTYNAATAAFPACNVAHIFFRGTVTDATAPTYLGTYTSGGAVTTDVLCNGTVLVTK
jgi:hypothetical protein